MTNTPSGTASNQFAHAHAPQPGIALVTGAAKRIGRAISRRLAQKGWDIAIHYNASEAEAAALADEIASVGRRSALVRAQLGNVTETLRLISECKRVLGAPTLLVNNASAFLEDDLHTMTPDLWAAHINTNLQAPVFLTQSFADALPDREFGNVINIIDQRVWNLKPEFFSYTLSKAALWSATQVMAQALAPRIRVNAIGPGPVLRSIHQTDDDFAEETRQTLLRRGASPDDIAETTCFILGMPAMTGQMIALDGGQHLSR